MSYKRTDKQERAFELLGSPATDIFLYGGSRSGKSFAFMEALIARSLKTKSRHCVLRQHFNHVRQSIWHETLPKVLDVCYPGLKTHLKFNRSDWFVEFPNGSEIWVGGLDDKERTEKILGKEYSTIFFNEISQLNYNSIGIAKTRLAERNSLVKKAYYDANPPAKTHWSYKYFILKQDPITDQTHSIKIASLLMNPGDNRENIDEEYIEGILSNLPPAQRKRFLDGEFTDDDEAIFLSSWLRPSESLDVEFAAKFTAVDPAIGEGEENDETAIITCGIDYDGVIHQIELVHGRWSFNRIVEECKGVQARHKPDYFGVEYVAFQKALGDVLSKEGLVINKLKADTDKVRRAITITDMLEKGRVRINSKALINQMLDFPNGDHDDMCLVGDTLIATKHGNKKIKDIKKGDYVLTPFGFKRVIESGCTGKKEVINKLGIKGTWNHRVFSVDTFKYLADTNPDLVSKLSFKELLNWRYKRLLFLMVRNIDLWGREGIILVNQKKVQNENLLKDYMLRCGNFIIKRKFLKVLLFTIKTVTIITTTLIIWSVYRKNCIILYIFNTLLNLIKDPNNLNISKKLGNLLKNGIQVKKGENNTACNQKNSGKILGYLKEFVLYVKRSFLRSTQIPNVVVEIVELQNGEENKKQKVYNITVEEVGCYYANNVLVSNCDALVYCLRMIKDYSQEKYIKKVDKMKHLRDDPKSMVFWEGFRQESEEENKTNLQRDWSL